MLLYDRVSDDNAPLQKYLRWSESLHGDGADHAVRHVPVLEDVLDKHEIVHISFSGNCAAMHELQSSLKGELGMGVTILATVYPKLDFTLIDILPPGASKGHAVARLAQINGLTSDNVMVVGDNYNDLEMLEYAGTAVVMGNAASGLRDRQEFYTTLTNDEGGVAAAIKRFILN